MFYSQLLLSKKGALGIIWMAAHCHKKLKKDQVQQTNISSSVDKILDNEVHVVTHRILAFLLLGIVRIYSKKVEYLLHDCHEIMNRLCSFKTGKSTQAGTGPSQRHYLSITLPKRFELDTFDLGLDQDAMGGKIRSHEQDTHPDGRRKVRSRFDSFCKDIIVPNSEAYSTAHTPPRDVFGTPCMEKSMVKPCSNVNISLAGVEVLRRTRCSLEDCLDPLQLDETEEEQMHNNKQSNKDWRTNIQGPANNVDSDSVVCLSNNRAHSLPSSDIFHGSGFTLDQLEPMMLDEAEQEQLKDRASNENASPNFRGQIQEEQMHDSLSDDDLRTEFQGPAKNMEPDFSVSLSNNEILSWPSLEKLRGIGYALEDRLEPMVLDEAEKEQLYDRPSNENPSSNVQGPIQDVEFNFVANQSPKGSNSLQSLGILHGSNLSLEHSSSFKLLNESEKRQGHDKPSHEEHATDLEQMFNLNTQLNFQEGEHQDFTGAVDNTAPVGLEIKQLEVIAPESVKCQNPEKNRVPILNPHSKLPADAGTTEVAAIQTPGRKERAKILQKRKAPLDVATVVPNKVLKGWIQDDPIDLKRESRKAARTLLQAWRAHKLFHVPHSFLEPLVPGVSVDLSYLGYQESCVPDIKSAKLSAGQDGLQVTVTHGAQENVSGIRTLITENSPQQTPDARSPVAETSTGQTPDVRSLILEKSMELAPAVRSPVAESLPDRTPIAPGTPVAEISLEQIPIGPGTPVAENSLEQIPIAPGTPVAYLNSLRPREAETVARSYILEPSSSMENIENWASSIEQQGSYALFHEETSSYKEDRLEEDEYSARTRMTASYLGRNFLHKRKQKEEEILSLSHILAGKTKKESTIMFYEILVLKTRDCIDVQQDAAYCDILLRETPKLRQYFESSR